MNSTPANTPKALVVSDEDMAAINSNVPSSTASGTTPSSQTIVPQIAALILWTSPLDGRGMLVVSAARRLESEGPLLAYWLPRSNQRRQKGALGR